ncbi:MAG: hypothetical protein R3E45_01965 [Rhodocyclaceae bacterium]
MQASSRSPTRRFALALAIATMSGASAADISSIDVGSTPRWLAADDRGVSALLADGRVVSIRGKEVVARGEGLSPDAPLHDCAGELLGVASDGALVSIDTNNRVSRSAAALLSPRGGLACAFAAAWGIAADGRLLRFERRGRQWVAVKQASAEALPDARIVLSDLAGNGAAKLFVLAEGSATRYRHGVLGDTVEPTALLMIDPDSLAIEARLALPAPMVFEDLLPRPLSIAARPALALVRASPSGGAALVLIGIERTNLGIVASGPDFGQSSRWLNPLVGASSLYAVLTPHIGGMLYRYQRRGDKLAPMPLATGVSTHRIGSRQLEGAAVIERRGGRVLILLPSQAQSRLIALDCNGRCKTLASYPLAGATSSNQLVARDFAWIGDEAGFVNRIALPRN